MQNWFATIALLSWPIVAIFLYSKLAIGPATILTILCAQLLLPVGANIKIPMIPQFDKGSIPSLCIAVACMLVAGQRLRVFGRLGLTEILIAAYLIGPIVTSQFNGDLIIYDYRILPGVGMYDAVSASESALVSLLPFFVGRQFLWRAEDIQYIFRGLVSAELLYTLPLLFEIRMSPQLHYWVYGYFPSDFIQSMRDGGFRPMAFMGHGLAAAFFLMMALVASVTLWRTRTTIYRAPPAGVTSYLFLVLILCKSLGATVYSVALAPLVWWAKPQIQVRVALAMVLVALLYPTLRAFDLFPTNHILQIAGLISPERAESLKFRFGNEDKLLARALERPVFGWGRFGRSRVFNPENGKDESVTDGRWVITLGQFGFVGFIAEFGLLIGGVFRATAALKFAASLKEKFFLASLSLIIAINALDLLPNSGLYPWTWLIAGALVGRTEVLGVLAKRKSTPSPRLPIGSVSPPLKEIANRQDV